MSRLVGIIFQDEGSATEALRALQELEASRVIAVSGTAMVEKDEKGAYPRDAGSTRVRSQPWWAH